MAFIGVNLGRSYRLIWNSLDPPPRGFDHQFLYENIKKLASAAVLIRLTDTGEREQTILLAGISNDSSWHAADVWTTPNIERYADEQKFAIHLSC